MSCPICMQPITNKCSLECNHNFCFSCIEKWCDQKSNCPICRSSINLTKIKKQTRFTRSMTIEKRFQTLCDELYILVIDANNVSAKNSLALKKYKIDLVLQKIYENRWILTCKKNCSNRCHSCLVLSIIKTKLEQFSIQGWSEANIWRYKFRNYL